MRLFRTYLLVIFISTLPFLAIFTTDQLPHTHDGFVHLSRMAAYYKALSDGQILPRWAGDLNFGYGLPLFNFMYHVPYLMTSLFIFFGLSLVNAFKTTLFASFLLSGIGMLALSLTLTKSIPIALFMTLLYQFFPFRLIELFVRGSIGEVYTYAFLPFVLFSMNKFSQSKQFRYFILISLSTALLILSHNSVSLAFFGLTILFLLLIIRKNAQRTVLGLLLGLGLSAFYWLPALFEHKYTYGDLFMKSLYLEHFPPLWQFFVPNFFNNPNLQTGGIATQIGIVQTLVMLMAIWVLKKRHQDNADKHIFFYTGVILLGSLFLMQPISTPLWKNISFLRQFQFPWRLLSVLALATALAGLSVQYIKRINTPFFIGLLGILTIFSTLYYWQPPLGFDKISDESYYWNYPLTTTYFGETDLIWSEGPAKMYPKNRIETIAGLSTFSNYRHTSSLHEMTVEATDTARLVAHIQYFPGWRVYVNNTKTPIEFQDQNWRGQITFAIPSGKNTVRIAFEDSPVRAIGKGITILSGLILFVASIVCLKKRTV